MKILAVNYLIKPRTFIVMPKSSVPTSQLKRRARFNILKGLERRAADELNRINEQRPERCVMFGCLSV